MTRILFTTPELEHPPRGGPKLRIENSIKALSRIAELVIVSRVASQEMGGEAAVTFFQKYCKKLLFLTNRTAESTAQGLLEIAGREGSEVLWLGYGNISYEILHYLKKLDCPYPVVIDTDSVWSRFVLRGLPYKPTFDDQLKVFINGWLKRWEEYCGTQAASATTAVSPFDAEYYKLLTSRQDAVHVFSNVIDLENYATIPANPAIQKPCIYLAGTFGPDSPMEEAALWVIDKVLPLAWRAVPELHFYVVGVGVTDKIKAKGGRNITVTGPLPSVLPYLGHASVAVVPLKYESGTRFKIMEAGACRIPIVSTTLGAEGIPVTHGRDILIADTPEDFARSIIELVSHPERGRQLAENCHRLISDHYSIAAATKEATAILRTLRQGPRPQSLQVDGQATLISQLAYQMSRSGNGEELLTLGLSLFTFLTKHIGNQELFLEGAERSHSADLLKRALKLAPNHVLLNEASQLCSSKPEVEDADSRRGKEADSGWPPDTKRDTASVGPETSLSGNGMSLALAALQAAVEQLRVQPANASLLSQVLSRLQLSEQDIKSAPGSILEHLDQLLRLGLPPDGSFQLRGIQRARGLCLMALSRLPEAVTALEQELVLTPADPTLKALLEKTRLAWEFESYSAGLTQGGHSPQIPAMKVSHSSQAHSKGNALMTSAHPSSLPPLGRPAEITLCAANAGQSATQNSLAGFQHFEKGNWTDALQCFDQVLAEAPLKQGANLMRGQCLSRLGQDAAAESAFQAEMKIQPGHPDALAALRELQNKTLPASLPGQPATALVLCEEGERLLQAGQPDQALQCFERALASESRLLGANYARALCLESLGRPAEAVTAVRRELELQPNHSGARNLFHAIRSHDKRSPSKATAALPGFNGKSVVTQVSPQSAIAPGELALSELEKLCLERQQRLRPGNADTPHARQSYARPGSRLGFNHERLFIELEQKGIVRIEGFLDRYTLTYMKGEFAWMMDNLERHAAPPDKDGFSEEYFSVEFQNYHSNNPFKYSAGFLRQCVDPELMALINRYFGRQAYLTQASGTRSLPKDIGRVGSYQWHHDAWGRRLHLMVLLTDVGEEDQYMTYAVGTNEIYHPYERFVHSRIKPEELAAYSKGASIFKATGKAGDMFLFDSNGLHSGNRTTGHTRDIFLACYSSDPTCVWGMEIPTEALDSLPPEHTLPLERTRHRRQSVRAPLAFPEYSSFVIGLPHVAAWRPYELESKGR